MFSYFLASYISLLMANGFVCTPDLFDKSEEKISPEFVATVIYADPSQLQALVPAEAEVGPELESEVQVFVVR